MRLSEMFEPTLLERHLDVVEALRPWANDPNAYISFTDIQKVGIKPTSEYNTPLGVYAYPVQACWNEIEYNSLPFAGNRPYVQVLIAQGNVQELSTYKNLEADIAKLRARYKETVHHFYAGMEESFKEKTPDEAFDHLLSTWGSKPNTQPFGAVTNMDAVWLWNITHAIVSMLPGEKPSVNWNRMFRELGYDGFSDKAGQGIIHRNEPKQAAFFSSRAYKHVAMFPNLRRNKLYGQWPKEYSDIQDLINVFFYAEDEGSSNEEAKLLQREWSDLLLNGKTEHFAVTPEFWDTITNSKSQIGTGHWDHGLAGLFAYAVWNSPGAIGRLRRVLEKHPEWMTDELVKVVYNAATNAYARLSRSDIEYLLSPEFGKLMQKVGTERDQTALAGQIIAQLAGTYGGLGPPRKALKGLPKKAKGDRYIPPEQMAKIPPEKLTRTYHDVMSQLGSSAKHVLKLLSPEEIKVFIRNPPRRYGDDDIPF